MNMNTLAFQRSWRMFCGSFHSEIPVYRQIMNYIQIAIGRHWLLKGDQLPTIREVHEKLNVNPGTAARAYRELELKGVISRSGRVRNPAR